jgi:hypothetical protein
MYVSAYVCYSIAHHYAYANVVHPVMVVMGFLTLAHRVSRAMRISTANATLLFPAGRISFRTAGHINSHHTVASTKSTSNSQGT